MIRFETSLGSFTVELDHDKAPISAAIEKVKQAASRDDVADIRRAIGELEQASHAMAQHISRAQASAPPSGDGAKPSGDGKKDDVIDAEFEVKK